ncbi:MAG: tRNA 2-thiouridine(34) synthase MnmA [Desulfuromonadales bacterium GWC2_61_20]|nr:MAG: tRNA 2-thiouridine(34) synthase MnmA [Desulfuromonadales bacterium GWC2_61_20]HAD05032.1 tRNA 2-thiouridine(34) synthase MnmA [Desulfuromonas sp.]HBT82719.1 tRNA 2-thiouridine(34) synthase MnmA [Desulfuromonas sp.]
MTQRKQRIVVAMSGGVDSSVTAALLKEQGHEVIGVTMQIWDYARFTAPDGQLFGSCCSLDDVYDARRVAEALSIPFYVVNFEADFQRQVIDPFCDDYFAGRTPNPCVLCNQSLKFERLLRRARELEADALATGHYARIVAGPAGYELRKGLDPQKDQSYFLFTLTQAQMGLVQFPLGAMSKEEVRGHAARFNLPVAQKAESQDICFVPDGNYVRFLEEERGPGQLDGAIVHVSGQEVGRHQGTYRFTVGQRRGLGIAWPHPLYVVALDAAARQVVVGEEEHLHRDRLTLQRVNWSFGAPPLEPLPAACRIRYRHHEATCLITPLPEGRAAVVFAQAQRGITPGQAAVFYAGDRVLGGGWIE